MSIQSQKTSPDPSHLRSEFADNQDMIELVAFFVDAMEERIKGLRETYDAGDLHQLRRLAHQLKGAATGYGFPAITQSASALEFLLKSESASEQAEAIGAATKELIEFCSSVRM